MSHADYQVLLDFEEARKNNADALEEFANSAESRNNLNLRLELIALDIEIRLKLGDPVFLDQYIMEYPALAAQLPKTYDEVKSDFRATFCPVKAQTKQEFPCNFEHFIVKKEIGRGGMGVVYQATNIRTHDEVALKVLFVKRSEVAREAIVLARLNHPQICHVKEMGRSKDLPFVVLELVKGENLKSVLQRKKKLDSLQASKFAAQIACALAHAHARQIIHLDIKPSNIHINRQGTAILTDFGLATEIQKFNQLEHDQEALPSCAFGSPAYMAPEFFNSKFGTPGISNDIYGLGIVLYEMLTGTVPFHGNCQVLVRQICHHPPPRPSDFPGSHIDPELELICLKAINKHAHDRFRDVNEFHSALLGWIEKRESRLERIAA